MRKSKKVSIRFRQSAYRLLKNSKFEPAYVFAELIDNSIQSYFDNKAELNEIHKNYKLKIVITKKDDKIIILDNAAGISDKHMERALEPGSLPDNRDGLNEFGIGLKNAGVWMSDLYVLETSAINEDFSKTVKFDYHDVINNNIEDIDEKIKEVDPLKSYTKITLTKLRDSEKRFDYDQIANQIASIYRGMLMSGEISISFRAKELKYVQPSILKAPYYPDSLKFIKGETKQKPKDINWVYHFDIPMGDKRMHGFVGILNKMQKTANGISYCRRGRVIEGAGDEKIFPAAICGAQRSSHQSKRIFGEFNFEGFDVSFDKGKLLAENEIEELIGLLADQLKIFSPKGTNDTYNMLKQANELRLDTDLDEQSLTEKLKQKKVRDSKKQNKNLNFDKKVGKILSKKLSKDNSSTNKSEIVIEPDQRIDKKIPGLNGNFFLLRYTINKDYASDILYDIQIRDVKDRGEKKLLDEGISTVVEGYINIGCPFLKKNENLVKGKSFESYSEFIEFLMISEAICKMKGQGTAHYMRDTINELVNI